MASAVVYVFGFFLASPLPLAATLDLLGQVRAQGYLPIVTFQYKEGYSPQVMPWQSEDFHKPAGAGAVINAVTKQGGNRFSGDIEDQFRRHTTLLHTQCASQTVRNNAHEVTSPSCAVQRWLGLSLRSPRRPTAGASKTQPQPPKSRKLFREHC